MIEVVEFTNERNEKITIGLRQPEDSGYAIIDINGLEPPQVDLKTTQYTSGVKYKYVAGFHKIRPIKMTAQYYEYNRDNRSIEELRENLYKYIKPNELVKMRFIDNYRKFYIEGYVASHQGVMFSQACGATIEIQCPEMWFYKNSKDYIDILDLVEATEIDDQGQTWYIYSKTILYDGTFRSGVKIDIAETTEVKGEIYFGIINNESRFVSLYIPESENPRHLIFSTMQENLKIQSVENGEVYNRIGWIDANSQNFRQGVPLLKQGENTIWIKTKHQITSNIKTSYNTLYIGV